METTDVLVVGGGLIGCSLALELARAGCRVTLTEARQVGAAASSAAAGMLSPTLGIGPSGPFAELCLQSAALYESWVGELREAGAGDVGFRPCGLIDVCPDPDEAEGMQSALPDYARPGRRAQWLPPDELRSREPALVPGLPGAAFFPDECQVTPGLLAGQVARIAERAGVQVREREPIVRLVRDGDRITAVQTAAQEYRPAVVVLAAGAWSGAAVSSLGVSLPTRPVKGQLLAAECRAATVRTPLHAGEAAFVPRPDGSLVVGVTVEEGAGFDDRPTLGGVHTILQRAVALVPAVSDLAFARTWAGLRPATPDEWPFMGPLPPLRNLWVSCGHFRKGILLAPLCARLVARSILAGKPVPELEPFRPGR